MRKRSLVVAALIAAPFSTMTAQDRATELGVGLSVLAVDLTDDDPVVNFAVGGQYLSVGLYLSPRLAIEPSLAISITSGNDVTLTNMTVGLNVPFYTRSNWGRTGFFFSPGAAVRYLSADAAGREDGVSQVALGFDIGAKLELAEQVSIRAAGAFQHWLSNDDFADRTLLGAKLGASVFLR